MKKSIFKKISMLIVLSLVLFSLAGCAASENYFSVLEDVCSLEKYSQTSTASVTVKVDDKNALAGLGAFNLLNENGDMQMNVTLTGSYDMATESCDITMKLLDYDIQLKMIDGNKMYISTAFLNDILKDFLGTGLADISPTLNKFSWIYVDVSEDVPATEPDESASGAASAIMPSADEIKDLFGTDVDVEKLISDLKAKAVEDKLMTAADGVHTISCDGNFLVFAIDTLNAAIEAAEAESAATPDAAADVDAAGDAAGDAAEAGKSSIASLKEDLFGDVPPEDVTFSSSINYDDSTKGYHLTVKTDAKDVCTIESTSDILELSMLSVTAPTDGLLNLIADEDTLNTIVNEVSAYIAKLMFGSANLGDLGNLGNLDIGGSYNFDDDTPDTSAF